MRDFAKLFHAEDTGQVLVTLESGDDGPEIKVSFMPEGLGVCSLKMAFPDTDDGWDKAEEAFGVRADEEWALNTVRSTLAELPFGDIASEEH